MKFSAHLYQDYKAAVKVINSIVNGMNSLAKCTNSIPKTLRYYITIPFSIGYHRQCDYKSGTRFSNRIAWYPININYGTIVRKKFDSKDSNKKH